MSRPRPDQDQELVERRGENWKIREGQKGQEDNCDCYLGRSIFEGIGRSREKEVGTERYVQIFHEDKDVVG